MKKVKRLEPLIDEFIFGILFVLIGYQLSVQLNHSPFGFLGVASIFWGCFKILIGLIIYAIYFYALLFKPEYFLDNQEKRIVQKIKNRIEFDLKVKNYSKVIDRYHYLINKFPNRTDLKTELAEFYLQQGNPVRAGRLLFFKKNITETEKKAVELFTKSVGNNSFQILKKVINCKKHDPEFIKSNHKEIKYLIQEVRYENEKNSWVVKNLKQHLDSFNSPFYLTVFKERKDAVINLVLILLLWTIQLFTQK